MPVDKPKAGETEEQYLEYCIPAEMEAGYKMEQATAMCYSTYRNATKMGTQALVTSKMRELAYRGINLAEGEGLEGACWEGWEAIGTKMLDGREVPNCVPIKE
jgi:hypothetical protein